MSLRGLYIHFPFCVKKCGYCDFYSLPGHRELIAPYVDAVIREAGAYRGLAFQTLYLGGGTPSLLGGEQLRRLVSGTAKSLDISRLLEATIEVNPESATGELLEGARASGIDRVSFGVQSLNDAELSRVGRAHDAAQAREALKLAVRLGFKRISADLIVGLPGQSEDTLLRSVATLVGLGVEHLSLYCLALEEGTPLAQAPPADLADDDRQAALFEAASDYLARSGFSHYEISNFAVRGGECRHNLNYWRGGEYLGLGAAAASHLRGRRCRNRADAQAYISNPASQVEQVEDLPTRRKAAEEAMLRLRLLEEGMDFAELAQKFGKTNVADLRSRLDMLVAEKCLTIDGTRYRLAPAMALVSNRVFAQVVASTCTARSGATRQPRR